MIDRDQERELLREWEAAIARAKWDLETLPPLIEQLRARLDDGADQSPRRRNPKAAKVPTSVRTTSRSASDVPMYRGKPAMTWVIESFVADTSSATADQIVHHIENYEP